MCRHSNEYVQESCHSDDQSANSRCMPGIFWHSFWKRTFYGHVSHLNYQNSPCSFLKRNFLTLVARYDEHVCNGPTTSTYKLVGTHNKDLNSSWDLKVLLGSRNVNCKRRAQYLCCVMLRASLNYWLLLSTCCLRYKRQFLCFLCPRHNFLLQLFLCLAQLCLLVAFSCALCVILSVWSGQFFLDFFSFFLNRFF